MIDIAIGVTIGNILATLLVSVGLTVAQTLQRRSLAKRLNRSFNDQVESDMLDTIAERYPEAFKSDGL